MTYDDCLDAIDSVRADNLRARHDPQLTGIPALAFAEASASPPCGSRVGVTQDDENVLAAPERIGGGPAGSGSV